MLGKPPNLVIVYTALKPRQRRTLTIVIEQVGKILLWQKKNTNSYLMRHYYSANEEWKSRDILFTIAEYIVQWYP